MYELILYEFGNDVCYKQKMKNGSAQIHKKLTSFVPYDYKYKSKFMYIVHCIHLNQNKGLQWRNKFLIALECEAM